MNLKAGNNSTIWAIFIVLCVAAMSLSCVGAPVPTATEYSAINLSKPMPQGRWIPTGLPGGGLITDMEWAADGTMFVTSDVGAFWRSRDDGNTWHGVGSGLRSFYLACVECSPSDPDVILLGTSGGVYRSSDGGDSWEARREGFPRVQEATISAPVASISFDEDNHDTVYCGTGFHAMQNDPRSLRGNGTLYRSDDAGDTWRKVTSFPKGGSCTTFSIYAKSERVLAATNIGLFESRDAGGSWKKLGGLPSDVVLDVIVHPENPNLLHVTLQSPAGKFPWVGGVWMSKDGGGTWEHSSDGLERHVGDALNSFFATSLYIQIVRDPFNPDRLMTANISWGTDALYISQNGGKSWKNASQGIPPGKLGWLGFFMKPIVPIAFDPGRKDTLYFGAPLIKSTDGGKSWFQTYCAETSPGSGFWSGNGLNVTCLHDVVFDPFDTKKIYAGYWDVGFLRSLDGGLSWQRSVEGLLHEGNVFRIQADLVTRDLLWASSGAWAYDAGSMAVSENAGASWRVIGTTQNGLPDVPVYDFVVSPTSDTGRRILALSYGKGLYLSDDSGSTWRAVLDRDGKTPFRYGYALAVDPFDQKIIYAGDDDGGTAHIAPAPTYDRGGVWKSWDAGETWEKLTIDAINVKDIAISPHNSDVILVASRDAWDRVAGSARRGGVHLSTDGGRSWEKTYNVDFAIAVEADPSVPGRFYVGTTESPYKDREYVKGILRSDDWGKSWRAVNTGLGMEKVSAIAVDPSDSEHMVIGTPGAGLFHVFGISKMK